MTNNGEAEIWVTHLIKLSKFEGKKHMKKITKSVVTSAISVSLLAQNSVGVFADIVEDTVEIENEEVGEVVEENITEVSSELAKEADELLRGEVNYEGLSNVNTIKDGIALMGIAGVEAKVEAAKTKVSSGKNLSEMKEAIDIAKKAIDDATFRLAEVKVDYESAKEQVIGIENKLVSLEKRIVDLVDTINKMIDTEVANNATLEEYSEELTSLYKDIETTEKEKIEAADAVKEVEEKLRIAGVDRESVITIYESLAKTQDTLEKMNDTIAYLQSELGLVESAKDEMVESYKTMEMSYSVSKEAIHNLLISSSLITSTIDELSKLDGVDVNHILELIQNELKMTIDTLVGSSKDSIVDELEYYLELYESNATSYEEDLDMYKSSEVDLQKAISNYDTHVSSLDTQFDAWIIDQFSVETYKDLVEDAYNTLVANLGVAFEYEYWGKTYVVTYEDILNAKHNEHHADKITLEALLNGTANIKKYDVCRYDYGNKSDCDEEVTKLNKRIKENGGIFVEEGILATYRNAEAAYKEAKERDKLIGGEGFGNNEDTKQYFIQEIYNKELEVLINELNACEEAYINATKQYVSSFVAYAVVERINELSQALNKLSSEEIEKYKEELLDDVAMNLNEVGALKELLKNIASGDELLTLIEEIETSIVACINTMDDFREKKLQYKSIAELYATTLATAIDGKLVSYEFIDDEFVLVVMIDETSFKYTISQIKEMLLENIVRIEETIEIFKAYNQAVEEVNKATSKVNEKTALVDELTKEYEELESQIKDLNTSLDNFISEKAELKLSYDQAYKQKESIKGMIEIIKIELNAIEDNLKLSTETLEEYKEKLIVVETDYTKKVNESNNKPSTGGSSRPKPSIKDKEDEIIVIEEEEVPTSPVITNPIIEAIGDKDIREYLTGLVSIDEMNLYSTFGLRVYANSRVTSIEKKANGFKVNGYMWIDNVKPDKNTWRELILVNVENRAMQYAYRKQGVSAKTEWLNKNMIATQNGALDLSEAGYSVDVDYNNLNSYVDNMSGAKIQPGTYQMFIRISDGKESFLFPLVDRVLSDGSSMESSSTLPEGFSVMDNEIRSLIVKVK